MTECCHAAGCESDAASWTPFCRIHYMLLPSDLQGRLRETHRLDPLPNLADIAEPVILAFETEVGAMELLGVDAEQRCGLLLTVLGRVNQSENGERCRSCSRMTRSTRSCRW